MARDTTSLAARFGLVRSQATLVQAAIVAAHGAAGRQGPGFRASDVRYFYLLFTNWLERDVLRPGEDLDLTQVRRALDRLCAQGWLEAVVDGRTRGKWRGSRYALTEAGLVGLATALGEPGVRRSFEEVVFVVGFAVSYRGAILARVRGEARPLSAAGRRRVGELLDPARLLRAARQMLTAAQRDLEDRVAAGLAVERAAADARAAGRSDAEVAAQIEALGSYQLHRMRPFSEMVMSLPDDLRRFETGEGWGVRSRFLFEPLAAQVRAQLAVLDALEAQLAPPQPRA